MDLEMAARLAEHLRLNAGYAYLDAKIIASDIGLVGQRPSDVPRSAFSLVATMDGGAWGWADADVLIGVRNQGRGPGLRIRIGYPATRRWISALTTDGGSCSLR